MSAQPEADPVIRWELNEIAHGLRLVLSDLEIADAEIEGEPVQVPILTAAHMRVLFRVSARLQALAASNWRL